MSKCDFNNLKLLNVTPKMLHLAIFLELKFAKAIFIFQISTLQFIKTQNFMQKEKMLNLGLKTPYLGIFGMQF